MSATGLLLLDTNVVVHLIRGNATGEVLDQTFGLRKNPEKPLISSVTVGELLAFARHRNWGSQKTVKLRALVAELVVVDIGRSAVLERYAFDPQVTR